MTIKDVLLSIKNKISNKKKYNKVFILEKDDYKNTENGNVADRIFANKGTVIQKTETSTINFLKKEKKVYGMPFVYRTKDKKEYFMSAKLTTNYIKVVLQDHYAENNFVITFPSFIIVFFGNQIPRVINTKGLEKEEIKNTYEAVFQGLDYTELEFFDFLKLVKKEPVRLQFTVVILLIPFIWYIYNTYQEQQEESKRLVQQLASQKAKMPQKKIVTDQKLKGILTTNDFIKFLYNINLKNGSFIGDVNIANKTIVLYSFAPMPNSFYKNNFFKKIVYFTPKSIYTEAEYKFKSPEQCINILGEFKKNVKLLSIKNSKITFRLNGQDMDANKTGKLTRGLYGCPIIIRSGRISYSSLNKRNVLLNIELFKLNTKKGN